MLIGKQQIRATMSQFMSHTPRTVSLVCHKKSSRLSELIAFHNILASTARNAPAKEEKEG
jgi:hypothetical protein